MFTVKLSTTPTALMVYSKSVVGVPYGGVNVKVTDPAVVAASDNVTVLVSSATLVTVVFAARTPVPPVLVTVEPGAIPAALLTTISLAGLGLAKSKTHAPALSGA